ncbi:MAG: RNA polymerase subunit sigma-24 [Anaerolineaceae bacterium]|nr:RNA polymerase subunit sigma-24 [Anaerolineaceae bacterium]
MTDYEQQLLARVERDPEAFRELYQRYFPRVFAYVAYRVRRREDAEDVVGEVFMQIVRGLSQFEYRGDGSFAAWVFRIAHNQVNQFYRRNRLETEPVPLDDLPEIQAHHLAPDGVLARKEQFAHLSALIADLPQRRREIVTLRFFGGLRNQEIARVLELDERTVASHLSRALGDLRRSYQPEEGTRYE